ncbi:efflux RND transporter permease subunit [candidate division KSB1 bacterium]|nr:efflux RND transporter permease subunit [candidate division KSB1 bacterium]
MQFFIHRKTLVSMLFLGLCILGVVSYLQLPVELLPYSELPMLIVQIGTQREMDPSYLEKQAIIPLEGAIGTLEGIDRIESLANRNRGIIFVYYNETVSVKYAYLKLTEKVNAMKSSLPEEFVVMVLKIDTEQLTNQLMTLQVRGSGGLDRVRYIIDEDVTPGLENIDGIANVDVTGGRERSVEVILDKEACQAHKITVAGIRNAIVRSSREKSFLGHAYQGKRHFFVNLVAEYRDVNDLENIILKSEGPVRLKDVAEIYVGTKERTTISRVNGKDAVTISLIRDAEVNLIEVARETRRVIDRLNEELAAQDIEIIIQTDSAEAMETNIDLIIELALIGGLLAILILWLFLRNLRLVVIIALAIPISILTAFNLFYAFDISINSITLVGMALAVGMLLDNSIVVLENIYRLMSRKKDPDISVTQGTHEVSLSVIAATLTTVAVFLPFIFSSEFQIKLFGTHIGVSIISTLVVSLVVALLLIPMITHKFLTLGGRFGVTNFNIVSQRNRLVQLYTLLLKTALRYPARTILGATVIFFISLLLCFGLSLNVQREAELDELVLYVSMPRGSTLENTDLVVAEAEKGLEDIPEKQDVTTKIYEEEATITIQLKEDYEDIAEKSYLDVRNDVQQRINKIHSAEISFDPPTSSQRFRQGGGRMRGAAGMQRMMGMGTQTEQVVIRGEDFDLMRIVADDIQYQLDQLESVERTWLNISDNRPELQLLFDTQAFSHFNVTIADISAELAGFESEYSSNIKYKQGTEEYDIVIRNEALEEKTIDDLKEVNVAPATGGLVALDQITDFLYASGLSGINRVNQEREIELGYRFYADINESKEQLVAARNEVDQVIDDLTIPSGISVEVVHEEEDYSEFYFLIAVAFILIYMILASVFESLSTPVVMMFTIPLAGIGSLWAIIFTGNSLLNLNTLVGFLILLGIVVNNGIILIHYTLILRQRGNSIERALLMAGQARVRPILITSITTIVAMFPLAMGKAEYVTRIGAPFAITVIGGLVSSTLFTLVFLPSAYSSLLNAIDWFKNLDWKIKLIQLAAFAGGGVLIYYEVDDIVWKFANLTLLTAVIPGLTYFIQTSLRRAQAEIIASDETLTIKIRHLVKIYDDDTRFVREWKKAERQETAPGRAADVRTSPLFPLIWQTALLIFLVYFVYFYLGSPFWLLVLSFIVYFYTLWFIGSLIDKLMRAKLTRTIFYRFLIQSNLPRIIIWAAPLINGIIFYFKWHQVSSPIFFTLLWLLGIAIYYLSRRLYREKVDINRITGRFSRLQREVYRFVKMIPIIGKQKERFRALNGVSLKIGSGMFGLLGPNGAGKTTLMRAVCGVLEQSRGTITINDINLSEKREELQSLIGYLPQEFGTYENMTAHDFLDYQAILKGIVDAELRAKRVNRALQAVHLGEKQNDKIGSYSGGMKQRVGIAQTLLHLPRILIVDEPTAGLDPRERIRFRNLLVELSKERIVIFSTHIIEDISSSCNQVAVLDRGKLYFWGIPEEMVDVAKGFVWQVMLSPAEFENVRDKLMIVHHIRVEDKIRVRFLARKATFPGAISIAPTLEDAYLWLLGGSKIPH